MTQSDHCGSLSPREQRMRVIRDAIERAEDNERRNAALLAPELRTTRLANAVIYALDAAALDEGRRS
jgi:hypothetical protein